MLLRAQIQRVVRNVNGPLFETQFLLKDCDPLSPMWTRDRKLAAELEWSEAEKLAPKIKAHAVVIAGTATETERAEPLPGNTRQEKISYYRRKLQREREQRRAAADALVTESAERKTRRIIQFQEELERRKLA